MSGIYRRFQRIPSGTQLWKIITRKIGKSTQWQASNIANCKKFSEGIPPTKKGSKWWRNFTHDLGNQAMIKEKYVPLAGSHGQSLVLHKKEKDKIGHVLLWAFSVHFFHSRISWITSVLFPRFGMVIAWPIGEFIAKMTRFDSAKFSHQKNASHFLHTDHLPIRIWMIPEWY